MSLVKYNNNSISAITTAGQLASGSQVLISEQTASSSSTVDFTSGIDSTYPIYKFIFINCHPNGDAKQFQFQVDTGTNTNYNQTITSTSFNAYHNEADNSTTLSYNDLDHAQGTGFQHLSVSTGNDNDQSVSGELFLFAPSNTTFVKHFLARSSTYTANNHIYDLHVSGYFNTTTALTRVRFQYTADTIDAGTIKMYGIKDS